MKFLREPWEISDSLDTLKRFERYLKNLIVILINKFFSFD